MIQNYLKIAWRNLLKHKSFSFINIVGLAIGISACLIIFLYVHEELHYDLYNTKADRIARITTRIHTPESDLVMATSPILLTSTLKKDYPEIESAVRIKIQMLLLNFTAMFFLRSPFTKQIKPFFPFLLLIFWKDQ